MKKRDNSVYLRHILDAIISVEEYLGNFDYKSFSNDKKTVDAVVRELEIIGEASNSLSDDFRNNHPEVPFRDIIDMRNILAHEYFGVNTKVVWDTCKIDLPVLKEVIEKSLRAI